MARKNNLKDRRSIRSKSATNSKIRGRASQKRLPKQTSKRSVKHKKKIIKKIEETNWRS